MNTMLFQFRSLLGLCLVPIILGACIEFEQAKDKAQHETDAPRAQRSRSDLQYEIARAVGIAEGISDPEARVQATLRVARVACATDKAQATGIFRTAHEQLQAIRDSAESDRRSPREIVITEQFLSSAAACDPALGKEFMSAEPKEDRSEVAGSALAAAGAQMRQGHLEDAVGLAHQAVASGLKGTAQFAGYIAFLQDLRTKDASEADGLFLQTMSVLGGQETVDVNDLLMAGTYVFQPSDHQTSGMRIGIVGPVVLVSVAGDRSNFPLSLKRAYLDAATGILSRSIQDPQQAQLCYAAAYELLPLAQVYAPNDAAILSAAISSLATSVSPSLTDPTTFDRLFEKSSAEPSIEAVDAAPAPQKDQLCLGAVNLYWRRGDFERARLFNAKVADTALKQKLQELIDFGEAVTQVKRKDYLEAETKARKLPAGSKRCLALMDIFHAYISIHDLREASLIENEVVDAVVQAHDQDRAYLLLALLPDLASLNRTRANDTLWLTIQSFNALDRYLEDKDESQAESKTLLAKRMSDSVSVEFVEVAHAGSATRLFILNTSASGDNPLGATLQRLALDDDNSFELASSLSNDYRRAQFLPSILHHVITEARLHVPANSPAAKAN